MAKWTIGSVVLLAACARMGGMDRARVEARVDDAVKQFGVQGRGVLVVIIDRGLDYTNNDFRNADGTTRVAEMFDLTDNTGANAPNNPYKIGTIYTQAQINAALTMGGTPLAEKDAAGHGTATAGIAAGNGFNSRDWNYRGEAPKATIVVVKVATGVPAPAGQTPPPDELTLLPPAFTYARDKAHQLGLPAVVLLNSGNMGGPNDGSSALAGQINAMAGPGIPGMAFVTGSSDNGGTAIHAQTTVAQGQTVSVNFTQQDSSAVTFALWYPQTDLYDVTIQTPTRTYGPYTAPPTNAAADAQATAEFIYNHYGSTVTQYGSASMRQIVINFNGGPGNYAVTVRGSKAGGGTFHAWLVASNTVFTNFVVPGYTTWELAAAANNISPNDYVLRDRWADADGVVESIAEDHIGALWKGTGIGPTVDGRLGVDISAPGNSVFASLAPASAYAENSGNLVQAGHGFYVLQNATSGAAPQVAGIIALMLEINPTLDAIQIRNLLRQTARSDAFTGKTPNTSWGYGKVDARAAVAAAAAMPGGKPYFTLDQNVIPVDYPTGSAAPDPITVNITGGNGAGAFTVASSAAWLTADRQSGTAPAALAITANPSGLANGDYDGEVTIIPAAGGVPQSVMVHLHVRKPGPLILGVVDGASFGPGFANGSWVTITGYGLSNTKRIWATSDFNGTHLPTSLDGVQVVVFSPNAYVFYISPTQINILAPDNTKTDTRFAIQVINNGQASNVFVANSLAANPQFFTFDGHYIAAVHLDGIDVIPVGQYAGLTTRPAMAGETIELFGTGCGATNPPLDSGTIITTSAQVTAQTSLTIGGEPAATTFVGLAGNGLCQVDAVVPADLPSGDAEVVLTVGASSSEFGAYIPVQ